jgi:hypothetical protein
MQLREAVLCDTLALGLDPGGFALRDGMAPQAYRFYMGRFYGMAHYSVDRQLRLCAAKQSYAKRTYVKWYGFVG